MEVIRASMKTEVSPATPAIAGDQPRVIFADHMVLQRDQKVADPGESVIVEFFDQIKRTHTESRSFRPWTI